MFDMETKQIIVFRKDLLKGEHGIRKGKFAGQVAHASLGALLKCFTVEETSDDSVIYKVQFKKGSILDSWLNGIFTKVVVGVESEQELLDIVAHLEDSKSKGNTIPYALITDCGKTEFGGVPTITCLGIGPAMSEDIDTITGGLKLL